MATALRKNRIPGPVLGLLLVIAAGLGLYFALLAPRAPAELPELGAFSGAVTVDHGSALIGARLPEDALDPVLEALARVRFVPDEEAAGLDYSNALTLTLEGGGTIALLDGEGEDAHAAVTAGGTTGYYRLSDSQYSAVREAVYAAFPEGVLYTGEELAAWWQDYFYPAVQTLMEEDFTTARDIEPEAVADYTFFKMLADGTAADYQVADAAGKLWCRVPYREFLALGQLYFSDGANASLKETSHYAEGADAMVFAMPADTAAYLRENYPAWDEPSASGGYTLLSVRRDLFGILTAEVADYNEVGFTEAGTLNRTHTFTLVYGSDGRYRYVSKSSRITDPMEVAVEGYFLNIGSISGITAADAEELDLRFAGELGGDMLLTSIGYGAEGHLMLLYRVNPRTGGITASGELITGTEHPWRVETDGETVLVYGSDRAWQMDASLAAASEIVLPELSGEYDLADGGSRVVYTDETGLWLWEQDREEPLLLAAHPDTDGEDGAIDRYASPRFILNGTAVLAADADADGSVLFYTRFDLEGLEKALADREKEASASRSSREEEEDSAASEGLLTGSRVGIYPGQLQALAVEEDLMVALYPNAEGEDPRYLAGAVHYFETGATFSFLIPDTGETGPALICGGRIYYFEEDPAVGEDTVFELKVLELGPAMNRVSTGLRVTNAMPHILAATRSGKVLFSFTSPSGSGMGIAATAGVTGAE